MPLTALLGFAAIALTLVVVPGPDWAYVLATGVRDHLVLPAVTGILIGYALLTGIVAAGLGPLVARTPFALTIGTVAGAVYLGHLGVRTLRSSTDVTVSATTTRDTSTLAYLTRGIGVSALNPKGLLLFVSILPQFAHTADEWPLSAQLATLGAVFITITAAVYCTLGYTANHVIGARPSLARTITRVAGVAMIVVATLLLIERFVTHGA